MTTHLPLHKHLQLEEWRVAREYARHFDDLLLRLRTFGIPIVVTILGAGIAFGTQVKSDQIPISYFTFGILFTFLLPVLVLALLLIPSSSESASSNSNDLNTKATWFEAILGFIWVAFPVVVYLITLSNEGTSVFFGNSRHVTFPATIAITIFALALLVGLYGLDRFYYFRLLIGAVNRSKTLEVKLGFELGTEIARSTVHDVSKNVITLLYFLPAIGAQTAILGLGFGELWFGT